MDLATLLGMVISFGLIIIALLLGSGDASVFLDAPSMFIVLGGTFGATLTQYPLPTVLHLGGVIRKVLVNPVVSPSMVVDTFLNFANRARREGILSLEDLVNRLEDPYLRKGMQLTVDGLEPEVIKGIMETEIENTEARHEVGIEMMNSMAAYAPALGIIGTVIGLVKMLNNMNDPNTIGPAMAIALITTFYGAMLANLVFLPIVGKLRHRSRQEVMIMEMQMEGVLGISRGENPRIIAEKLSGYLPPKERGRQ